MYERILVPLDGSKAGEAALPYVTQLISKLSPEIKIEVTLLQVLTLATQAIISGEAFVVSPYTKEEMEQNKKNAMDYLNNAGETIRSKGVTITARVGFGEAYKEIVEAAAELDVDLIAMSTHGRSGLSRWAFGSVTDKVLRHGGGIPILMVKALE